jgi:hypothetical protein
MPALPQAENRKKEKKEKRKKGEKRKEGRREKFLRGISRGEKEEEEEGKETPGRGRRSHGRADQYQVVE